jgi:hypothetical protein
MSVSIPPPSPEDERVRELAREYWELWQKLRKGPRRQLTRRHKETYTRWLEIFREIMELRPNQNPVDVIDRLRPS